jgi:metallo-beta-lactamase family protein
MRITPCGAVGEVTGSGYLVETDELRLLVDFGSFQGTPDSVERNRSLGPVDPTTLDAVLLTHAHTDHTGRLPLLAAAGCVAPIYATVATRDLTMLLLRDAAGHAEEDLARENRRRVRASLPPLRGLFDREDIDRLEGLFRVARYDEPVGIAKGVSARFRENGHILGSASVELRCRSTGGSRSGGHCIVFSGDIGPKGSPILRDPVPPTEADCVFLESTYGDRDHGDQRAHIAHFIEVLRNAIWAQRTVLIPAFAIGRTQTVLFHIAQAIRQGELPACPIYLDSPMASRASETYRKHRDLYDAESAALTASGELAEALAHLVETDSVEASKRLNETREACVIIAGGGMCEGGRIVHHLKHHLPRRETDLLIVGFMARGTLGRRLLDGAKRVDIDGVEVDVRATVHDLDGFSAHAGQSELIEWLGAMAGSQPRVVLTHGEEPQREALAAMIAARFGLRAERPMPGDQIIL